MNVKEEIKKHIASQPEPKRSDMLALHVFFQKTMPKAKLWFLDGKDSKGKSVTNPNIGYGPQALKYADGKSREFYQIGFSANTSGISVYVLGLEDKNYLSKTFGKKIGKASVTGYCIKFKNLKDINTETLAEVVRYG